MLFISPPFGNYLHLPYTNQILGSFTLDYREGLLKQIIYTLRYSYKYNGWINKIGLRNKGIDPLSEGSLFRELSMIMAEEFKDIKIGD